MNTALPPSPGDLALAGLRGLDLHGRPDRAQGAHALRRVLALVARAVLRRVPDSDLDDIVSAALLRVWPTNGFRGESPVEAFQYLRRVVWTTFADQRVDHPREPLQASDDPSGVDASLTDPSATLDPQEAADAREFLARLARVRVKLLLLAAEDARPSRPGPYLPLRFFLDECLALSSAPNSLAPANGAQASTWRYRGMRSARALVERHRSAFDGDADVLSAILDDEPPRGQSEVPGDVSAEEDPR